MLLLPFVSAYDSAYADESDAVVVRLRIVVDGDALVDGGVDELQGSVLPVLVHVVDDAHVSHALRFGVAPLEEDEVALLRILQFGLFALQVLGGGRCVELVAELAEDVPREA